jgi:hypothetical protein
MCIMVDLLTPSTVTFFFLRVEYVRNIGIKSIQLEHRDELYSPECVMIIDTK